MEKNYTTVYIIFNCNKTYMNISKQKNFLLQEIKINDPSKLKLHVFNVDDDDGVLLSKGGILKTPKPDGDYYEIEGGIIEDKIYFVGDWRPDDFQEEEDFIDYLKNFFGKRRMKYEIHNEYLGEENLVLVTFLKYFILDN